MDAGAPAEHTPTIRAASPRVRAVIAVLGMAALIGANYFLRSRLERSKDFIYSFFGYFFPELEKAMFGGGYPWTKMLLPIPELAGAWVTTTLIVTHWIELQLTPPVTWYVFNAALIMSSFLTTFVIFRSLALSFTFAICMGFGTQLYATYAVTGSMGLCLLLIYYQLVLLCAFRMIEGRAPVMVWRVTYMLAVVVTALAYESWLDFAVFLWLAGAFTAAVAYRFGKREWWPGLRFAAAWLAIVFGGYLYIKLNLGYGQVNGAESDVVFNYPQLAPAVEDVISNVLTQFYIVITNFLPPMFVTSTALYEMGGDKLVELQHGYHTGYSYLVVMQYMFLWRYYAGATFVVFIYVMYRTLRGSLRAWSPHLFAISVFLLMTLTGGPTHAFVKARPMNSMPLLGYHVIVGVMGLALLLSYLAYLAVSMPRRRGAGIAAVAVMWAVIFYSALARPGMLTHEAAHVGLGVGIYPNPMVVLLSMFGRGNPPALTDYRLTKFVPATLPTVEAPKPPPVPGEPVPFGGVPAALPNTLSNLMEWTSAPGVTVTPKDGGYRLAGNTSDGGYQLSSPWLEVPPGQRLIIRVKGAAERGRVCLGALNKAERWLLAPTSASGELSLETDQTRAVMLVLVNCGKALGAEGAPMVDIESVSYALLVK